MECPTFRTKIAALRGDSRPRLSVDRSSTGFDFCPPRPLKTRLGLRPRTAVPTFVECRLSRYCFLLHVFQNAVGRVPHLLINGAVLGRCLPDRDGNNLVAAQPCHPADLPPIHHLTHAHAPPPTHPPAAR